MSADRWYSDACNLLETGKFCAKRQDWRGAYRNLGMATEHLLKALYLRNHQLRELPADLRSAKSHDLIWLAEKAGIGQDILSLQGAKRTNWLTVRDWDQGKRYPNEPFPAIEGKDLKLALLHPTNGIWQWLSNLYLTN